MKQQQQNNKSTMTEQLKLWGEPVQSCRNNLEGELQQS